MTIETLFDQLKEKFGDKILEADTTGPNPLIKLEADTVHPFCKYLREECAFEMLHCVTGIDYPEHIDVVYSIYSYEKHLGLNMKVSLPREKPEVESVTSVWRGADWLERETYDLLGVTFKNHPDHRRILLPDDYEGHPLRRDFQTPKEWHGMKIPYELREEPENR